MDHDQISIDGKRRSQRATTARAKLARQQVANNGGVDQYEARMARLAAVRRREHAADRGWCILRTNGRRTLTLAASLNEAGIEAWTPREVRKRRLPRGRKGFKETVEPIVPSFVFARAQYLPDLLRTLALPSNPHPTFSIFQHAGRAPVVADREIAHLQAAEETARISTLKTRRHNIVIGSTVSPSEGAFAGLSGVVESVRGKVAEVCFNEHFRVKVATWLLIDDQLQEPPAHKATAAKAA